MNEDPNATSMAIMTHDIRVSAVKLASIKTWLKEIALNEARRD